jgi:hypothetical protein
MWPFNKIKKEKYNYYGKLNNCPICNSDEIEFTSRCSDYFRYCLKIKCEECHFIQELYGDIEKSHTPENFKNDWDKFINAWNNRGNK